MENETQEVLTCAPAGPAAWCAEHALHTYVRSLLMPCTCMCTPSTAPELAPAAPEARQGFLLAASLYVLFPFRRRIMGGRQWLSPCKGSPQQHHWAHPALPLLPGPGSSASFSTPEGAAAFQLFWAVTGAGHQQKGGE